MELSWNENLAVTSLLIILLVIADDDRVHLSELNAHEVPNLHLHFIRMHVPAFFVLARSIIFAPHGRELTEVMTEVALQSEFASPSLDHTLAPFG